MASCINKLETDELYIFYKHLTIFSNLSGSQTSQEVCSPCQMIASKSCPSIMYTPAVSHPSVFFPSHSPVAPIAPVDP